LNLEPQTLNLERGTLNLDDDIDGRSFLRKYGIVIGVFAVIVTGGVVVARTLASSHSPPPRREQEITMVKLLPPAPLPPPPPPPPEIQEQKMIEQTPVDANEPKPDDKPAPPSPSLGTGIKGNGPADGFGLSGSGGSGFFGGSATHGSGSRWGWYAGEVQMAIRDALGKNSHTRTAGFRDEIRIWLDATGRITRAQLVSSTGDPAVDAAIKDKVLDGLQLQDPPPAGMPMPIVMRITELRPN
jgi:TonB family protein